ncbi:type II toxin-antitoxin system prevent-host-death family antitoxin [Streptomyces sp. S3(2020)]|nr:type II toxin-antitoxin system prevent-host-death family antitoxin [Streptomyces sp. S3(2020)]
MRNDFTDLMNRVVQSGEVIEIQKYGTTQIVMISKEHYERLTRDLMRGD